jgi:exonuclease SbcD
LAYVALGHIHKAQSVGGKEHIRYSGSPLPMSFTELHYAHQVMVFELEEEGVKGLRSIDIPVSVPLIRVPHTHQSPAEVLAALAALPLEEGPSDTPPPYLEVRVLCDGPEPSLRQRVQEALEGKQVRLAKIDVKYRALQTDTNQPVLTSQDSLKELQPVELFARTYQSKYGQPVSDELVRLFHRAVDEVHNQED